MKTQASTCSLFHELFATDWMKDDKEFEEELRGYESALKRLLSVDSELTTFIKTQPILDYDQLSSVPVVSSTEKTIFVFSVSQNPSGSGYDYSITSSDSAIFSVFKRIDVVCGSFHQQFNNSANTDLVIEGTISQIESQNVHIECQWGQPLVELSPPLAKFMGQGVVVPGLVALKLLSHINSKHMNNNGEVKCDALLKSIFNVESFKMDTFGELVNAQTTPLHPLVVDLMLPSTKKALNIQYPVMSTDNAGQFRPICVEPAPVRELLEECVKSKQQIECIEEFLEDPVAFTDNEVTIASRETDLPELYTSTYLYDQPWVIETGEEYLKTLLYRANPKKK